MRHLISLFFFFSFILLSHFAEAQVGVDWSPVTTAGPASRDAHAIVYDSERETSVLFGGDDANGNRFDDTWEWNGTEWLNLQIEGPEARNFHAMAYDTFRKKVVLFGGQTSSQKMGDTWEFDSASGAWNLQTTDLPLERSNNALPAILSRGGDGPVYTNGPRAPSARTYHAMVYDVARRETVLFGGSDAVTGVSYSGETWVWNGSNWRLASKTGPSPRILHAMAYDKVRQRVVLFGGSDASGKLADTWEWNGSSWSQKSTTGPSARESHSMAFDGSSSRVILFGGSNTGFFGDTWAWNGTAWTIWAGPGPYSRNHSALVWDEANAQLTLFGGSYDNGVSFDAYSDTWVAPPATPPEIIVSSVDPKLFPNLPKGPYGDAVQGLASDFTKIYIGYDDVNLNHPSDTGHIDILSPNGIVLGRRTTPVGAVHTNDLKYDFDTDELLIIDTNTDETISNDEDFRAWRIDARDGHTSSRLPLLPITPAGHRQTAIALDGSQIWSGISTTALENVPFQMDAIDSAGNILESRSAILDGVVQGSFIKDGFLWLIKTKHDDPPNSIFYAPSIDKYRLDTEPMRNVGHWDGSRPVGGVIEAQGITTFRDRIIYSVFYQSALENGVSSLRSDLSDKAIEYGSSESFYVAATGTPPLYFQWRKNGIPLSNGDGILGATTNSLTIDPMDETLEGQYDCVVSNLSGQAITNLFSVSLSE
ncbi:MAG: hypothetical protein J0L93_00635 [Deltaproteobacteria bacterium]|nr:hypothetical protein [Deltaproteobacteria bacterium]